MVLLAIHIARLANTYFIPQIIIPRSKEIITLN